MSSLSEIMKNKKAGQAKGIFDLSGLVEQNPEISNFWREDYEKIIDINQQT